MNTVLKSLVKSSVLIAGLLAPLAGNAGTATLVDNTIYLEGVVDEQMYNEWKRYYNYNVTNVRLESPGGSVYWGRKIAEDIYDNKHRTYTEAVGQCASMCAIIWMSADNHWYNPNQAIGFHFSYNDNVDNLRDSLFMDGMEYMLVAQKWQTTSDFIDDFKYLGNKNKFDKYMQGMLDSGLWPSSMWWMTIDELEELEGGMHYK